MVEANSNRLLSDVADYYSSKLAEYGEQPRGVDWNGEESQHLRFAQLCKVIDAKGRFSVNDLGCGYGALLDYLHANYSSFGYLGFDISQDMIKAARVRYPDCSDISFSVASQPPFPSDFTIASGIFNVRLQRSNAEWIEYIYNTLDIMHESSLKGFAFNCLTKYSDADKMRDYLYYADPCALFDRCKTRYSRQVALLHDYGLFEFTIIVRKTL